MSFELKDYSYCESIHAGALSPWHVRKLTAKGHKYGGGIDTKSLCGKVDRGWDIRCDVGEAHDAHTCKSCLAVLKAVGLC